MTNAEYIKNLSKEELAAFLERIYECGRAEDCFMECPWRRAYNEFGFLFRCPTFKIKEWLDEQLRPEQEIFEVE